MQSTLFSGEILCALKVGKTIEFDYPAANYFGVKPRMERRRLRIERIQDMVKEPPAVEIVKEDPLLRRGPLLAIGQDLDKGAERSFYVTSMKRVLESKISAKITILPKKSISCQVFLFPTDEAKPVYQADDAAEAMEYVDEFNQAESGRQTGFVAFADIRNVCRDTA